MCMDIWKPSQTFERFVVLPVKRHGERLPVVWVGTSYKYLGYEQQLHINKKDIENVEWKYS